MTTAKVYVYTSMLDIINKLGLDSVSYWYTSNCESHSNTTEHGVLLVHSTYDPVTTVPVTQIVIIETINNE